MEMMAHNLCEINELNESQGCQIYQWKHWLCVHAYTLAIAHVRRARSEVQNILRTVENISHKILLEVTCSVVFGLIESRQWTPTMKYRWSFSTLKSSHKYRQLHVISNIIIYTHQVVAGTAACLHGYIGKDVRGREDTHRIRATKAPGAAAIDLEELQVFHIAMWLSTPQIQKH